MSAALFRRPGRLALAVLVATLALLGYFNTAVEGGINIVRDSDTSCFEELDRLISREELGEKIKSFDLIGMITDKKIGFKHCTPDDVGRVYSRRVLARYFATFNLRKNAPIDPDKAERLFIEAIRMTGDRNATGFDEEVSASLGDLVDLYLEARLPASRMYTKLASAIDGVKLPLNAKDILVDRANAMYSLVPRFSTGDATPSCRTGSANPAIRALLVGNEHYGRLPSYDNFAGAINDVKLMETSLQIRGNANIRLLIDANRDTMITEMRRLVDEVQCGDFVLFHFSGLRTPAVQLNDLSIPIGWEAGLATVDADFADKTWSASIWNAELANFVTAIRNRWASVVMILDAGKHALAIRALQDQVASGRAWVSELGPGQRDVLKGAPEVGQLDMLDSAAAGYAIFDPSSAGADDAGVVVDVKPKNSTEPPQKYGLLSYALARLLQTQRQLTVRLVADGIAKELASLDEGKYFRGGKVAASDPDMRFLEPARPLNLETLAVEILSPKLNDRGHAITEEVITVDEHKFELIGRVPDASSISYLTLNNRVLDLDSNGKFATKVTLVPGQNSLTFDAFGYDNTFRTKTIKFAYNGDLERFAASGERYALVIGIKDYDNYPPLETPEKDALAVAEVLRKSYGFRTDLDLPGGQKRDLVLLNATRPQITSALHLLQRLTKNDSLLIYYAGHGKLLKDNDTAYWIPKDGDADDNGSWYSGHELRSTLKRMDVRSVLVVSDSCFSGAMATKGPPDLSAYSSDDRRRGLLKDGEGRSRIFISSGGTEPVLDKGCKESEDHSVFACAFLAGLKEMEDSVFSSKDLYYKYIYQRVRGRVDQDPQHQLIVASGHVAGDFVFAKTEAQALGRKVEAQVAK